MSQNQSLIVAPCTHVLREALLAEAKLNTTILEMRRASESIFDETKKIAGALSNSQTRGKFGEAQLELLLQRQACARDMSTRRNDQRLILTHQVFQISPSICPAVHNCLLIPNFLLNVS